MKWADVVIARFPYAGGTAAKVRPAVVVQGDRLNVQIDNTILVMVTGNTALVGKEPTQFLIDPATTEGQSSGLTHPSAVKCENLMTVPQTDVRKILGHLSDVLKKKLEECLKEALQLQ
jgi:mRNA interferase MazF